MKLTIQEITKAVNGTLQNENGQAITSVEFDTRKVSAGSLFVPLKGNRDGHEFIQTAIENGAVATLWSLASEKAPQEMAVILVEDTLTALQALAKYYLQQIQPNVIAITGSNGKTTTKDMTEAVLAQKFITHKTQGNFNNDIGMPYTILQMPENTEKLILEMGMDHANEIIVLSKLAEPEVAAITMVGEAHIENLGSRLGIAKAKMEIAEGLQKDGLLVVPADEPLLTELVKEIPATVEKFGLGNGDLTAKIVKEEKTQTTFEVDGDVFQIPVPGAFNVKNALIAYAIGKWYGVSVEEMQRGFANLNLTQNRTQWLKAANGADILSDVYNANPTAMGLVLDTFGKLPSDGKRYAVLADMLELGPDSKKMHAAMADHITPDRFAGIFLYGGEMTALQKALAERYPKLPIHHFDKAAKNDLITAVKENLRSEDSVVLKGSNGMGLMEVVTALTES